MIGIPDAAIVSMIQLICEYADPDKKKKKIRIDYSLWYIGKIKIIDLSRHKHTYKLEERDLYRSTATLIWGRVVGRASPEKFSDQPERQISSSPNGNFFSSLS